MAEAMGQQSTACTHSPGEAKEFVPNRGATKRTPHPASFLRHPLPRGEGVHFLGAPNPTARAA